ncbi:UPF0058 family protein [Halapricum hydrolyticum]|uniref:UPF0058 family protein n=1 Tax=Halapricum hydrolyticum TaxID=2979991 RepID=A0AAE3IA91_9EURY|nr:UPF0058 family protein [Halapricum hydrolyticum]MCU4716987.1 UPF0058 family protein [Halapricum hydrolyticum]MCU4725408.1 UPF0058 family protein [Halapricum hydrolyticum]
MRKKEYIHTHALLAEVTGYLIENETMPVDRLTAYNELETCPSSIHETKQKHHEAIMALSSAIGRCLKEIPTDSHGQSVDQ